MKILMFGKNRLGKKEPLASWNFFQIYFKKFGNEIEVVQKNEIWKILKFSKINQYDILFTVQMTSFFPVLFKKLRLIKIPVIHYWADNYYQWGFGGKWLRSRIENWIAKNADFNFTISRFREEKAKKLGIKKIKFFPQGVVEEFDKIKPSKRLKGKIKVVYGGEISRKKGVDKVIEAAKFVKEADFYIFGNVRKDIKPTLKNLQKNVHVFNQVSHKELISYYKAADVLIFATDNDSTLKMYEYIKAGKPILALNNKVKYVLKHKETAYLTDDLSQGLKELAKNKKLGDKISKNLKKCNIYTWDEVSRMYLKEINRVLMLEK